MGEDRLAEADRGVLRQLVAHPSVPDSHAARSEQDEQVNQNHEHNGDSDSLIEASKEIEVSKLGRVMNVAIEGPCLSQERPDYLHRVIIISTQRAVDALIRVVSPIGKG